MKKFLFLLFAASVFLNSRAYFSKTSAYKGRVETILRALLDEDYDEVMRNTAMEHELFRDISEKDLKDKMIALTNLLNKNFKNNLELSFMGVKKDDGVNIPADATLITFELSDGESLGVLDAIFDDSSDKIIALTLRNVKEPKPSMFFFWLFGLLTLCVPIFNLYVIYLIEKSSLKRKWIKYLAVIFLNVPSLVYMPMGGFSLDLLSFQVLLGIGVHYMNYFGAAWAVAFPLGGAYWLWRLKTKNGSDDKLVSLGESSGLE